MKKPKDYHERMLQLKRWNTPTIYNGWEQITERDIANECFNIEETTDFMPQMGSMVGYAVTVIIEPSEKTHKNKKDSWSSYRRYVSAQPGPKIVVVKDLDKPSVVGSFWGEVNSNIHKALGCVGTITDGAIRDLDEMTNAGFKALARRLCVGHAYVAPVRWDCEVDVFGTNITPGQLIHADKHGFLAIPPEDEDELLEAAIFMDTNEISTVIRAARETNGKTMDDILRQVDRANEMFSENILDKFKPQ